MATRRSPLAVIGALLAMCASGGCAARARPIVADRPIALNGHGLRLHFANANRGTVEGPAAPLLVFASGDGGMHRKDLDAYRHLVALGYPIVGFDAHDYVTHLGQEEATTPARLATDYERIIETARHILHLGAGQPVVLVGVSRGAGLSVVAAGQRTLRDSIAGVVAVALTQEEEYVHWHFRSGHDEANPADRPAAGKPVIVEVYKYLPRLGDVPIAVIQSTRDNYLPAAAARAMFGPDTRNRRFQAIDASNHSFGGARSELYDAIRGALAWVAAR